MSESVHKFVHEGYGTKVKITTNDVSLSSILETFTHYLKACGFSMDGRSVEAVLDEPEQVPYSPPSVRDAISLLEDVETPDSLSDYHQERLLDEVTRLFNGNDENDTHRLLAALLSHRSASLEAVVKLREDLGVIVNSWPSDEKAAPVRLTDEELDEIAKNDPVIIKALARQKKAESDQLTKEDKYSSPFEKNISGVYNKPSPISPSTYASPVENFTFSSSVFPSDLAFSPPEDKYSSPFERNISGVYDKPSSDQLRTKNGPEETYPVLRAITEALDIVTELNEKENEHRMCTRIEEAKPIVKDWLNNRRSQYGIEDISPLSPSTSMIPLESFGGVSSDSFSIDLASDVREGMTLNPDAVPLTDECPLTWNEFRLTEEELEAKKTKSSSDNFFSPQCKL